MYAPTPQTLRRLAIAAGVGHLVDALDADWDRRQWLTPPGVVWSVQSDTCMTGRLDAPNNIAYGEFGQEFVFRQPRDEGELEAILRASRHEALDCYRFDGLSRWTVESAEAWREMTSVVRAWLDHSLESADDVDIARGLTDYRSYLGSDAFSAYWAELISHLEGARA